MATKIDRLLQSAETSLTNSLLGRFGDMAPIPVANLQPEERSLLTIMLFMPAIQQLAMHGDEIRLLLGRFPDYLINPDSAEIELNGGGIGIGSTRMGSKGISHRGFGAQLSGPRQSPLPNYPFPQ